MDTTSVREQILFSPEFVVSEVKKVQTLYKLKKEIRYNQNRKVEHNTESVAEHMYGMYCLVDYFLPLENPDLDWNQNRIRQMVQYHDIDEIETGDVLGQFKSAAEKANERNAAEIVIEKLPQHMKVNIRGILNEYEAQQTPEAKFVKAIDKIEPVFHLYNPEGKETLAKLKTTKDQHDRIKLPYVNDFVYIKRFVEAMTDQFKKEGFFH